MLLLAATASCTDPDWDISTNWTVDATFYSNNNCSLTNGQTSNYTMPQFMELYKEDGSCKSVDFDGIPLFLALRCVDGKLGRAYYNGSDSACSFDAVMVETGLYSCVTSVVAAGPYLGANCTGITDTSDWSNDDEQGGDDGWSLSDDGNDDDVWRNYFGDDGDYSSGLGSNDASIVLHISQ